jgi:hypothetical protein
VSDHNAFEAGADQLVIGGPSAPASRKRWWIGGAALGVLAIGGGVAAWAAASFFGQGSQPAEALPDSTIGYVSIDLDPSGGQKIAALRLARKFPAFKDKVGLQTGDDIRKWIFDKVAEGNCDLDFDRDVAPWLGSRAAVAAVGADEPRPVVVVQTSDADKAKEGVKRLVSCGGAETSEPDFGWTIDGDWIVFAETTAKAEEVVRQTAKGALADDPDFQSWTDKAGDSGIVTAYASPAAGQALAHGMDGLVDELSGSGSDSGFGSSEAPGAAPRDMPSVDDLCSPEMLSEGFTREDCEKAFASLRSGTGATVPSPMNPLGMLGGACPGLGDPSSSAERMRARLADFGGAAATLRFGDDGLELEMAGDLRAFGAMGSGTSSGTPVISTLPADTAAALGVVFPAGWTDKLTENLKNLCGDDADPASLFTPLSRMTGLHLPGDLEKLFGDSAALALGPGIDVEGLVNGGDASNLPVALKTRGDEDTIDRVAAKLRQRLGAPAGVLEPVAGDDAVVVGLDRAYAEKVAASGKLGSSEAFTSVVPDADRATSVLYVSFDALDDVVTALAGGDDEVTANLAPLKGLGVSGWTDGDDSHSLLKLSVH